MCVEKKCAMGGAGSTYVYGYMDSNFKENMSEQEVKKFILHRKLLRND